MAMEVPSSWDALRKQARKLEAQLDDQMVACRRIVSAKASSRADAAETDLESGIKKSWVSILIHAWVSSGGSEVVSHTLTRHQEILQDLTQEFYRLKSSVRGKKEHAFLLDDFREFDQTPLDLEDCLSSSEQSLLKERATVSRSTGQMDNVISQAQATLGALVMQRSTFGGINSKISNVTSHFQRPFPEADPVAGIECPGPPGIFTVERIMSTMTIFFNTQDDAIRNSFSAKMVHEFSAQSLLSFLVMFHSLAKATYGTAVPAGEFVPGIMIRSTHGCLVGMLVVKFYHKSNIE